MLLAAVLRCCALSAISRANEPQHKKAIRDAKYVPRDPVGVPRGRVFEEDAKGKGKKVERVK